MGKGPLGVVITVGSAIFTIVGTIVHAASSIKESSSTKKR